MLFCTKYRQKAEKNRATVSHVSFDVRGIVSEESFFTVSSSMITHRKPGKLIVPELPLHSGPH